MMSRAVHDTCCEILTWLNLDVLRGNSGVNVDVLTRNLCFLDSGRICSVPVVRNERETSSITVVFLLLSMAQAVDVL
jgi:hypothetical protein